MNYNTLMNKPTINYRELIGDNTVTEVGGITEEQFNTLLNTDLSSYYTKAEIDDLFSRSYVYREKSGSIVTFDCPASVNGIDKVVSEIVAVQSGTGDPSPTNVRPISGWSAVNVTKSGVNLWSGGDVSGTTSKVVNIPIRKGTYNISAVVTSSDTDGTQSLISFVDVDGGTTSMRLDRTTRSNSSVTLEKDVIGLRFYAGYNNAQSQGDTFTYADIQLELSTTATSYEPYNGTTYTTALKDGQGNPMTCYGGQLTNENGVQVLIVTHGYIASYNGETLPSTWLSDRDVYAAGTTPTIGAEVVYELTTTEQITQDTLSISSQSGINNIWCDSGDITVKALNKILQG